ncbi:MAG TPA: SDR family NAD(P)-dependent oxidoreductase [Alphaproteobacteria bacterium]|nr:SDR family NAD(P)-dependent oxidoreductase [Alphaproteobacteria bacterium]
MGVVDDKVVIVTGGARSLGAAEAGLLAAEGGKVTILDIRDERGRSTTDEIVRRGGDCRYLHCDVRRVEDWDRAIGEVVGRHGRIDVLVNNAGINIRESLLDAELDHFEDVMATNLYGPLHGIRAVAPHMKAAGKGSIVNIVSTNGLAGGPFAAYATSKWALRGLIKCAALELAQWQIRVNGVCPGLVPTEINEGQPYIQQGIDSNPMGRAGTPQDIAALVLFLASDASAYISGADIPVDGGGMAGTARYRGAKYTI